MKIVHVEKFTPGEFGEDTPREGGGRTVYAYMDDTVAVHTFSTVEDARAADAMLGFVRRALTEAANAMAEAHITPPFKDQTEWPSGERPETEPEALAITSARALLREKADSGAGKARENARSAADGKLPAPGQETRQNANLSLSTPNTTPTP